MSRVDEVGCLLYGANLLPHHSRKSYIYRYNFVQVKGLYILSDIIIIIIKNVYRSRDFYRLNL